MALISITDYLGTSSNWSFGRRVLILAYNKVFGDTPLPHEILHFDGSSYELGWDGRKAGAETGGQPILPIGEYARFLIGAVKYHCGQLFHLFDENDFMDKFEKLQRNDNDGPDTSDLWYIHYVLILALGKALLGQTEGRRPPGAELFVHAMKLLPSMIYLWTQPIESTEILCCIMIYLQCLDLRIVAYNYIGQAMRIAITNGWHTDIPSQHFAPDVLERCRRIWWTVYTLDCHMSVLQGTPIPLNEWNISSQLPNFGGSEKESRALRMHVKLAKIIAFIQQTVYRVDDSADGYFLKSIKTTLKYLAKVNDERLIEFPLKIDDSSHSISRLSAHFYLFHHQAIILAIKPLLFFFFKRRLEASKRIRIPTAGGVRALARIGVGSAQQIMKTLAALRTQDLLERFIPFDLESVWHATLVILVAHAVDPTICKTQDSSLQVAHSILNDMASRGNLIAACRKAEFEHLDMTLSQLDATIGGNLTQGTSEVNPEANPTVWEGVTHHDSSVGSQNDIASMMEWNLEEVLSGQHLEAVADSLDLSGLDWFSAAPPQAGSDYAPE